MTLEDQCLLNTFTTIKKIKQDLEKNKISYLMADEAANILDKQIKYLESLKNLY